MKKIEKVKKILEILKKIYKNDLIIDDFLYGVYGYRKIYLKSLNKEILKNIIDDLNLFNDLLDFELKFSNKRISKDVDNKYFIILKF